MARLALLREDVGDLGRELVDVEGRGVDDEVGRFADRREPGTLDADAVQQGSFALQRMRSAHGLEPTHQHVVGRVEEEHPHGTP